MKKKALYALTCALFLTSCNDFSIENNENPVEKQSPIQFFVQMEKETLSFPTTKSMPENTIGEPTSVSGKSGEDADLNEFNMTFDAMSISGALYDITKFSENKFNTTKYFY